MDMLRFHKFTIGRIWVDDYGSSDNPEEFKALCILAAPQPQAGTKYPATLITTADHDDRVVPAQSSSLPRHCRKAAPDTPVLIRIETRSGHGASSTTKMIELTADIYSFIFYNLGVTPKY